MKVTKHGFLPMPYWMANYAIEHDIDASHCRGYEDKGWREVYSEMRQDYPVGISMVAIMPNGEELCGDVVMNTASFVAIEDNDGTVWAVDWRLLPYE